MRREPCEICGRPTAVNRFGVMREHTRTEHRGLLTLTVRCRGSLRVHPPNQAQTGTGDQR